MTIWAIVPAAGIGQRMGSIAPDRVPKQYLSLLGKPVLAHSLERLLAVPGITRIVVVLHPEDRHFGKLQLAADPRITTALGGEERQDSVLSGLGKLSAAGGDDWVLVHDAVRPCITSADILSLLNALADHPAGGLLAAPMDNTLKEVDAQGRVVQTVDRSRYWQALTPQLFRVGLLRQALTRAREAGVSITDEAAAVEALGQPVAVVPGDKHNIKITHESDLLLAENLLALQSRAGAPHER